MDSLTWPRALAWRMRQQMLEPLTKTSVEAVVARLGAVRAQSDLAAELSVNTRRTGSKTGDVANALADGRLIKSFAFRGATHLMTPEDAGIYLALRGASTMWELPSWQTYYKLGPSDWPDFRAAVREALAKGPLTRQELGQAVTVQARFRHLAFVFEDSNNWTLLKALAWQGDICFSPSIGGRTKLQRLDSNPRWKGVPDLEDAGPRAVKAYFAAYGPAAPRRVNYWLGEGLGAGRKRVTRWIAQLGEQLAEVVVDGESAFVLREHLDELLATSDSSAVRLLPAFDDWVLGPGTADAHVTPPARRALITRGANVVTWRGVVSGTWSLGEDRVAIDWFPEAGARPGDALVDEIARLGRILGRDVRPG